MSDKPVVVASIENDERDRCVDVFLRSDGTFGFEEYRRDVEDQGRWTRVGHFSPRVFKSKDEALAAAETAVAWLRR